MRQLRALYRTLFLLAALFGSADLTLGQTRVHIYIRAFIPSEHSGNPGYVRAVPAQPGRFVIPAPQIILPKCFPAVTDSSSCFSTDDRLFSKDATAAARATIELVLVISGSTVTVERADGRDLQRTDATRKVNCQTGLDLVPAQTASTANIRFGTPAFADGVVQIVVDGRASNPLITPSPDVQFGGTFTFNTQKNTLRFLGGTKVFPAYEAYAQLNGGPIVPLFQNLPEPNTTVCDLIDLGTGFKLRNIDTTVTLPDNLAGGWESTDPDKRFTLQVTGSSVVWTERGTAGTTPGATLSRTVSLTMAAGRFRIERPNDSAVLTFLGFQPQSLRDAILARNPPPSFITLSRSGDSLSAEWNGLLVTKNPDGTLKEIIAPGIRPSKPYVFRRGP